MSTNLENNKDTMQEIMDEQKKLDRNIIKQHDLFNESNEVDLTVNFDEQRKEQLHAAYKYLKSIVFTIREVGAKWWKNQSPMTEEQSDLFIQRMRDIINSDWDMQLSNISMKNIAIIQELIELEDAVNENKSKDEIHDEFVDILHFVVSLGLDLGINSADKLKELYLRKNAINHTRQQSNY